MVQWFFEKIYIPCQFPNKSVCSCKEKSCPIPEKPMNIQLTMNNRPEKPNPIPNRLIPIAVERHLIQIHENLSNPVK